MLPLRIADSASRTRATEAEAVLREAPAGMTTPVGRLLLGLLLLDQNRLNEAEPFLSSLHQEHPRWGAPMYGLALIARERGDDERAGRLAAEAVRRVPRRNVNDLARLIGVMYLLPGYESAANRAIKRVLRPSAISSRGRAVGTALPALDARAP